MNLRGYLDRQSRADCVVHVYPSGRLGNQLYFAANALFLANSAMETAKRLKIVWHTNVNLLSQIQSLLNVAGFNSHKDLIFFFYKLGNLEKRHIFIRGTYKFLLNLRNRGKIIVDHETLRNLDIRLLNRKKLILSSLIQDALLIGKIETNFCELPESLANLSVSLRRDGYIAVHIRQGDFLEQSVLQDQGVLDLMYYKNVISTIRGSGSSAPQRPILIFSDDPPAAKFLFSKAGVDNFEMASNFALTSIDEMRLMGTCEDLVLSTSTFSWWAGYFAKPDSKVHAPFPLTRNQLNEAAAMDSWTRHPARFID